MPTTHDDDEVDIFAILPLNAYSSPMEPPNAAIEASPSPMKPSRPEETNGATSSQAVSYPRRQVTLVGAFGTRRPVPRTALTAADPPLREAQGLNDDFIQVTQEETPTMPDFSAPTQPQEP